MDGFKTEVKGLGGKKLMVRAASHPDPAVPDYDRLNRAVIVNYGGEGLVLDFVGGNLEHEIEGTSRALGDLGLDDAPDGITIWEGRYIYSGDRWEGYDSEPSGDFRDPTDEEWGAIKQGLCPWDASMYHRGPYCDAPLACRVHGTIDGRAVAYDVCEAHKDWPGTRFDPGTEVRAEPISEVSLGSIFKRTQKGCYAERDGWKEEWDAYEAAQAAKVGEDADPA